MRKSITFGCLILLLAAAGYRIYLSSPPPAPRVLAHEESDHPGTGANPSINARPQAIPIARAAQPTTELPYTRKPEGNVIEFEVSNGLAIAYGDVILGRPDAGSKATRGYYETPTPQLWDKPEIPYAISPELPNPARVEKALDFFRSHTPVRFVPYEGQHDALIFEPGTEHCYSNLGKMGGLQTVKLAPGCQPPEIMHEIMHALGFVHEQSRPDRDRYVEILWSNIEEKYQSQFAIVPDVLMEA
ncbi:MAG: M12 family metallopeptidase, partial [Bdellovibrionota bacterium]